MTRATDKTSDRAAAAAHLVAYRDGLAGHLLWLAKATATLPADEQTYIVERLFAGLGPAEARRRGAQIATIATSCWGDFQEKDVVKRLAEVDILRAVCLDTATAVRDAMHRDSCVCGVTR
jgi:hypothetical protein